MKPLQYIHFFPLTPGQHVGRNVLVKLLNALRQE